MIPLAQRSFGENLCRALGSTVRSNGNSCSANLLRQFSPIRPLLIISLTDAKGAGIDAIIPINSYHHAAMAGALVPV